MFTATQFSTVEDKEKFVKQFIKFVESDFASSNFPMWFYKRLSMTFGHIAHYNRDGFYGTWFTTTKDKLAFIRNVYQSNRYGDPSCTYSDVEKYLTDWVITSGLLGKYESLLAHEEYTERRAQYDRLKAEFGSEKEMCTVMNLCTSETQVYTCPPKDAVIAAFAQSRDDWNTWDYNEKYGHLVKEGNVTFICGDFSAFKDGREF